MNQKYTKTIKIVLAVLFILCLFSMPYGFFNLVRFAAMLGFALLAYASYKENQTPWLITYIALAILFQPFAKIALGRDLWNIVDVIVAVLLIISVYTKRNK